MHDDSKFIELPGLVHKVTACHLADTTCFLMLNGDDRLAWGASKTDNTVKVSSIEVNLKET